ncbi:class I SAM-dependent methyltransferase [Alsobacter sp. SYSU M60028]|uniref:Class I SAM-dependent methyltransferase n=1 Tax=Alsobacter ponti TaxID=2962936 RepID=A0ABT1L9E8_9HYPH|nr:class I SAM-dependent methyltransferase [Alsobacter ponti]MCP8936888.1 class I SAM-dependent methyltransferase [Alsobacter ponti]
MAGASLDNRAVEAAYARWAPVYDVVFTAVMAPGRRAAVAAAERPGGVVLDVGVGTGLELPMFSPRTTVIGVDLSEPMLRRAKARVERGALSGVAGLLVMDATRLAFPDASVDVVVAPYVMTVVPDPARTLDEFARVVKPGGEIVLVNHIGAETGLRARAEAWLARRSASLGWRPEFPWALIGDWIAARPDMDLVERRALPPASLFTLVRIRRTPPPPQSGARENAAREAGVVEA